MQRSVVAGLFAVLLSSLVPLTAAEPTAFPLKDGDVWVMAGDSITAQHLHSNYFEAFCYARYPQMKFAFRNSGVGGHTIPTTLARFDYDIEAWKPTVVSVELGMNDQGGTPTDKFIANMKTMVERIRAVKARPVILSASPINDGGTLANPGRNGRLNEYATALKGFAAGEHLPYADQFHALVDVWGQNKPRENLANALGQLTTLAKDDSLAGVEHLRAFLTAQAKDPRKFLSMQGDPVHPGPNGQLMMAAALLQGLGADGFVSSVTIDVGQVVEAKGCRVDGLSTSNNGVAFDRLDERLPFPLPDGTVDMLAMFPAIEELSQYQLTVKGLIKGPYTISINGVTIGLLNHDQLAKGVNLTALIHQSPTRQEANPLLTQSRAILNAVAQKEGLVGQWRGLSKAAIAEGAPAELKSRLAELTKQVEEADEKIRAAARPQKLRFAIMPTYQ